MSRRTLPEAALVMRTRSFGAPPDGPASDAPSAHQRVHQLSTVALHMRCRRVKVHYSTPIVHNIELGRRTFCRERSALLPSTHRQLWPLFKHLFKC